MIKTYFTDVKDLKDVEAIIVFDNQHKVLDSWTIPKYNPTIFNEVGESFLHIFGLMEHLKYEMQEVVLPFDRGIIFAVSQPEFYMVVVAGLEVEASLIRLAVDVNMKDFLENKKAKKLLKKLSNKKFYQIKSITLDDVEKIMFESILEDNNGK